MTQHAGAAPADAAAMAQHERLLQALLHGDALGAAAGGRRLIQTHISSLVLAGDVAFKLRKPLKLPFLDFSTAALRRDDCLHELRLNRRTAPALYLDVRPILGTADAPRLGAAEDAAPEAIDWVLRMRRFEPGQVLDAMADAGTLGPAHIDALAAQVAAFHASLAPSPVAYGGPETVRRWLFETLDGIAADAAPAEAARIAALRSACAQAFDGVAARLALRRAQGCVRECHGDLHLANIVLVDGVPQPFDGIEFNPELRHIDVVDDIAFTFMDLLRHGLPRLAWRFVSGWAELTGDFDGLALLRFFAAYRALVRARVALLRGAQDAASTQTAFARDLALAEQLGAAPARPARLLLTCGLSGSGKSTAASMLAQALGGVRLRSDVERKRLFGLDAAARPTPAQATALYAQDATQRTYARLGELARELLRAGIPCVVDAAALRRDERDALRRLAATEGAPFTVVECRAPEAALRARIAHRLREERDASDADEQVLDLQLRVREPLAADEAAVVLATDCTLSTLAQRCEALARSLAAPAATIDRNPTTPARP